MNEVDLPETVWTIGHSTHPIDVFLAMLNGSGIETLCDVRRFAGSRRNPQYSPASLRDSLESAGIRYLAIPELGGRRKPAADSVNDAWRNEAFRGYADFMATEEYSRGFQTLMTEARVRRIAIMCSEAVWWRCHRGLVADDLRIRGVKVMHIMGTGPAKEHPFTSAAQIRDGKLSYRK